MCPFFLVLVALASAKVYFREDFGAGWKRRWIAGKPPEDKPLGAVDVSAGLIVADPRNVGLRTLEARRHYTYTASMEEFDNLDKALYVQFTVKFEQEAHCAGCYLKLIPRTALSKPSQFTPETPYELMFGPDVCPSSKVETVLVRNGTQHKLDFPARFDLDHVTHLFLFGLYPNNTYEIRVDGKRVKYGAIDEDFSLLPRKMIHTGEQQPEDWDMRETIPDPTDVKPADWDVPKFIPDPSISKPEAWDDETDGEWVHPTILNPDYKYTWLPRRLPNPNYKGHWRSPLMPNPDYHPVPDLYHLSPLGYVGLDVWQVEPGSILGNIIVTDSPSELDGVLPFKLSDVQRKEEELFRNIDKALLPRAPPDVELPPSSVRPATDDDDEIMVKTLGGDAPEATPSGEEPAEECEEEPPAQDSEDEDDDDDDFKEDL